MTPVTTNKTAVYAIDLKKSIWYIVKVYAFQEKANAHFLPGKPLGFTGKH